MERKKVWCRYRGTAASPECLGATTRQGEQTLHATLPWAACRQCLETMGPGKMIMQTHKGTGPARPGLSLPNTGEACATGGTSTTVPCGASMSRCKQEQLSKDDDTDRVLISSPLIARYRHMATRAVVVVVWTARDEIQPSFSISHRPATTDTREEEQSNVPRPPSTHRPELGPRHRTTAPNRHFSRIDRTWTTPSSMALATRRCRHVRASIGLPASPRPCRRGQTASMGCILPALISGFWAATAEDWAMPIWAKTNRVRGGGFAEGVHLENPVIET